MKKQKGITLIALVITIIVLLILAAVSITALTDEDKGVVTKAKQAASKTETAADEEDADIKEIINYVDEELAKPVNNFTIQGTVYQADIDMTFEEWINSEYNTGGFILDGENMCDEYYSNYITANNGKADKDEIIADGAVYYIQMYI